MKLMHPLFSAPLDFGESSIIALVIENPDYFQQFILDTKHQIGGKGGPLILSDDLRLLDLDKVAALIVDPFSLDWSNRALMNKVMKVLSDIALGEDFYLRSTELINRIKLYGMEIVENTDINLEVKGNPDVVQTLKLLDIGFVNGELGLDEELLQYIEITSQLFSIRLFAFVNAFSYLSCDKIALMIKDIQYQHNYVLFIESKESETCKLCRTKIIDSDLCEIDIQ